MAGVTENKQESERKVSVAFQCVIVIGSRFEFGVVV